MSAQDWRDYFQLLNGRAPTEAEFQRAVADGAVTSSDAGGAGAEQATTAQQATTPQQPPMGQQSVPAGAQQPVGTQQFAGQQQFVGQPTQMAGQPMAMTAPAQPAGDSAFVTSSKGYWQHLKQAWLHPMSVDVAVKDGYAWVTFGVILAVVVITVTYTVPSVGNFFKALVLLGGFAMLLTVAAAALTRLLLNVRCTFTDMLKLGTQSVIPLIPLSILFLLNVLLMKSRVESAYSGAASDLWRMLNGSSSYDLEDVLPFLRAGEFFLTVTAVLLVVLIIVVIMSAVVQSTYFYRLAAFTPGAQIERFGWLVALNTVMVVLMGIVIVRIWIN
ncbi:hypothetical protein [Propionibacterium freudenreichii]|uniref:hypothetical protein n=1 Tax=Propionibacterium freudenreichii TaxID=1744 RepID=UPI0021A5C1E2|nr:hypothetical protein [Propionibacterium freudenreichii]WGU89663.1 hypothetical protein FAM23877_08155 [Propionibacterium freudenreichii]